MPRPFCLRKVGFVPGVTYFKPAGVPLRELEEIVVTLDELEAIRLADLQGLYQEQAAERMKISRPTFARVIESARKKVADALIHGKALRLEGGAVITKGEKAMPGRDETGPACAGRGWGRGPCGKGRQHQGSGRRGPGRHGGMARPDAESKKNRPADDRGAAS
jgi:predicted DNA-binding protein (UPF0251 family)